MLTTRKLLSPPFEYQTDLIGWALASAASLLPDADLPTSKLGRALFWLSTRLEKRFGHRTLTHSFIAIAAVALLASPYVPRGTSLFLVRRGRLLVPPLD